jgi:broad specificity phosphatase PhoE
MKIVLIRHFKVGYKWKFFYNSEEYEVACAGYNAAAVIKTSLDFPFEDHRLITSTMGRALDTSRHIFNRDPDLSEETLCEVPIKPFVRTRMKLPKLVWDVFGRLHWRLNLKSQPEPYTNSVKRVSDFIDSLIAEKQNAIIVGHGWIIKLMIRKLKASGFKGPSPIYIKNGKPYEYFRTV